MNNWEKAGFLPGNQSIAETVMQLEHFLQQIPSVLRSLSHDDLQKRPAEGKWSKKEILGHLIDSALNNLKRFTEIQFLPSPYSVQGYRQVELVEVNHYQDLPLEDLLRLWTALNKQIIHVIQRIPQEELANPVDPQYENRELRTLEWVIGDYAAHMEHHYEQLTRP